MSGQEIGCQVKSKWQNPPIGLSAKSDLWERLLLRIVFSDRERLPLGIVARNKFYQTVLKIRVPKNLNGLNKLDGSSMVLHCCTLPNNNNMDQEMDLGHCVKKLCSNVTVQLC